MIDVTNSASPVPSALANASDRAGTVYGLNRRLPVPLGRVALGLALSHATKTSADINFLALAYIASGIITQTPHKLYRPEHSNLSLALDVQGQSESCQLQAPSQTLPRTRNHDD